MAIPPTIVTDEPTGTRVQHGTLQPVFRIFNVRGADIELTREQAIRLYQQLGAALYSAPALARKKS